MEGAVRLSGAASYNAGGSARTTADGDDWTWAGNPGPGEWASHRADDNGDPRHPRPDTAPGLEVGGSLGHGRQTRLSGCACSAFWRAGCGGRYPWHRRGRRHLYRRPQNEKTGVARFCDGRQHNGDDPVHLAVLPDRPADWDMVGGSAVKAGSQKFVSLMTEQADNLAAATANGVPPRLAESDRAPRSPFVLVLLTLTGGAAVLFLFNPSEWGFYPFCFFYRTTGLLCPGCGSLRAMHQLLHGHFVAALHFNALFVLSLPLLALYGVRVAVGQFLH